MKAKSIITSTNIQHTYKHLHDHCKQDRQQWVPYLKPLFPLKYPLATPLIKIEKDGEVIHILILLHIFSGIFIFARIKSNLPN